MAESNPARSGTLAATKSVLCVDDDPSVCALLARRLSHLGYAVATATTGKDALEMFAAGRRFDAMITDYRMPGTNGIALARDAVAVCPALLVFLLTGLSEAPSREVLRESGITAAFGKPLDFAELARELESALGERSDSDAKRSA